ncbi:hypothetical protein QNM99_27750 [Pseudomonas sp. PCH446]
MTLGFEDVEVVLQLRSASLDHPFVARFSAISDAIDVVTVGIWSVPQDEGRFHKRLVEMSYVGCAEDCLA